MTAAPYNPHFPPLVQPAPKPDKLGPFYDPLDYYALFDQPLVDKVPVVTKPTVPLRTWSRRKLVLPGKSFEMPKMRRVLDVLVAFGLDDVITTGAIRDLMTIPLPTETIHHCMEWLVILRVVKRLPRSPGAGSHHRYQLIRDPNQIEVLP